MNGKTAGLLSKVATIAIATTLLGGIDRAQARNATILPPYDYVLSVGDALDANVTVTR
jgi:hypothetical protein